MIVLLILLRHVRQLEGTVLLILMATMQRWSCVSSLDCFGIGGREENSNISKVYLTLHGRPSSQLVNSVSQSNMPNSSFQ